MSERLIISLHRAGLRLNSALERPWLAAIALAACAVLLKIASLQIGITRFSPDSWSYFELSKTIFGPAFYQFNTFRSYFSQEYSASFPLGYPSLIAIVSSVFGERPLLAVDINIAATLAMGWVLLRTCRTLHLPALAGLAVVLSVLLYPPYLDEVLAGRAMPAALLAFVVAGHLQLRGKPLTAGLALGLSVLFRFDFLVYALLFQAVLLARHLRDFKAVAKMALGFAAGIAPWVAYSLIHFGKPWISDNSWVALSALPAFVVDYPAAPVVSAAQSPMAWLHRVLGNVGPLLKAVGNAALLAPALLVFVLATVRNWPQLTIKTQVIGLLLVAAASTAPYLLTGYFDARYFSLVFLCLTLLLVLALSRAPRPQLLGADVRGLCLIAIALTLPVGLWAVGKMVSEAPEIARKLDRQTRQIEALKTCHQKSPDTIYIFVDEVFDFAPMYGGLSGMRTAFVPSNYLKMTEAQRQAFFDHLQPHRVMRSMEQIEKCNQQQ